MNFSEEIISLKRQAKKSFIPIVRDKTIMKISNIIEEENYKSILEIGTAIGYSGIIMLASNKNATLTTIEKDHERFVEACENFKKLNFESQVQALNGDAFEVLSQLLEENRKYDFIFLDGPKGQYIKYLPILKKLLQTEGTLFADNILMNGLIKDEARVNHKNRSMVKNMKEFIFQMENDSDFLTEKFNIDDGFLVAKLKKSAEY